MHKFLRTVGFSNYKKKHDIEKLLQDLIDQVDPSQIHKIQIDEVTNLCQVRAEMAHDMGLDIYGEMDEFGVVRPEYYVPYMLSHDSSSTADCSIQRHTDRETFAGLLDENRVGISLIFYMENHVIAFQLQIIYFLFRKRIDLFFYPQNISNNSILVTFNPTRHKAGIYDGINVLFLDSSGDLGIHINVIYGQSLHGVFIAVFCSLN